MACTGSRRCFATLRMLDCSCDEQAAGSEVITSSIQQSHMQWFRPSLKLQCGVCRSFGKPYHSLSAMVPLPRSAPSSPRELATAKHDTMARDIVWRLAFPGTSLRWSLGLAGLHTSQIKCYCSWMHRVSCEMSRRSLKLPRLLFDLYGRRGAKRCWTNFSKMAFFWPSGWTIRRARARLDIAAMLMTRRFFQTVLQQSFDLHLTCDSSPVTGMDIFGGEVDIFSHACSYRKFTLPGATLAHGHTTALSKALSLTWSLWLLSGPSMASLESVLSHLRSITSDWGVESFMVQTKNALAIFGQRLGLAISPAFRAYPTLFPYCAHIGDWNHTLATVIKASCEALEIWPEFLSQLRSLVKFYKNNENRNVCQVALRKSRDPEQQGYIRLLDHFTATFIKWRYETICEAVGQVCLLTDITRRFLCAEWFGKLQPEGSKLLAEVLSIAKKDSFWKWLHAMQPLTSRVDKIRRWGNGCACHAMEFKLKKPVVCDRTSRRMGEARKYMQDKVRRLRDDGARVQLDMQCQGDHAVYIGITFLHTRVAAEMAARFRWLSELPYLFANASDAETANEILRLWGEKGPACKTVLVQWLLSKFDGDLQIVADGGACSTALKVEEQVWRNMRLSSSSAEGYHRSARLECMRAPAASLPWLLSTMRFKENLQWAKEWVSHPEGLRCFCFDYQCFTRIVQPPRHQWRRSVVGRRRVLERVYRLGDEARIEWKFSDDDEHIGGFDKDDDDDDDTPAPKGDEKHALGLLREFLLHGLQEGNVFSIAKSEGDGRHFFQVLSRNWNSWAAARRGAPEKKPKHIVLQSCVQMMSEVRDGCADDTDLECEGDAEMIDLSGLASWTRFIRCLQVWTISPSDYFGALHASNPRDVRRLCDIEDSGCPVAVLMMSLHEAGWKSHRGLIRHHRLPEGGFDKKFDLTGCASKGDYYRCLLRTELLFENGVAEMRSDQCQAYYRCLLAGHYTVLAGHPAELYSQIFKGKEPVARAEAPPVARRRLAAAPVAICSSDDDDILEPRAFAGGAVADGASAKFSSSSGSSSSPSSASHGAEPGGGGGGGDDDRTLPDLPGIVYGAPVAYEDRCIMSGYHRLIMTCQHHMGCRKKRNLSLRGLHNFSMHQMIAYLAVWHQRGQGLRGCENTARFHVQHVKPTQAEIDAWMAANPE